MILSIIMITIITDIICFYYASLGFIEVTAPAGNSSTCMRRIVVTSTAEPKPQYIMLQSDRYVVENVSRSCVYRIELEIHDGQVCRAASFVNVCVVGPPDAPVLKIEEITPAKAILKWNHPQTYPRYSFITKYLLLANNIQVWVTNDVPNFDHSLVSAAILFVIQSIPCDILFSIGSFNQCACL